MWILENTKDPASGKNSFYLLEGQNYTVGRKDCKILILNDSSVSRKHATLTVTPSGVSLNKPEARPVLTLADSSKFGSVRNGNKIDVGSSTALEDDDNIIFGAMNSNQWRVTYKPLAVAFSSLASAEKKLLKSLTRRLGGHVATEWSKECTHLIMTQLTVTIKVIGALVTCRPIVTPAFLHKLEEAALTNSQMPNPINFQPAVAEAAIREDDVSFQPNTDRKTLFQGKTFVFLAQKQFKQLGQTVQLAGGKSLLIEGLTKEEENLLIDPDTIVVYADPSDQSQVLTQAAKEWVLDVMNILKTNGLRPVPQSELGLAVLYASTDVHCNPTVAQAWLNLLHPVAAPSLPTQDVLASQTQLSELPRSHSVRSKPHSAQSPHETINKKPETKAWRSEQTPAKKRMRDDDDFDSPSKVPRRESVIPPVTNPETTPAPSRTRGCPIQGASPELPYVGKPPSLPQETGPAGFLERAKMENNEKEGTRTKASPTKLKQVSVEVTTRNRLVTCPPKKLTENRDAAYHGSSIGDDVISPSEMIVENRSSRKVKEERQPEKSRRQIPLADDHKVIKDTAESVVVGTFPDDDVIPPSGSDVRGRRMGRRKVDDLFAMGMDDVREEDDDAVEPGMWKKKTKRSRLTEEDQVSDGVDVESRPSGRYPLQDVPTGYITANKTVKSEPTSPQDPTLPYNVAVVEHVTVAIRRPVMNASRTVDGKGAPRNFKRFKKARYAGQYSMPRIIGGSDLKHHGIGHIMEAEEMMEQERETLRKRHKENDLADKLFNWDPRSTKRRR